jgi:hypothetical protein
MAFVETAESQAGLVTDAGELHRLASGSAPLTPQECMERAERAAMALDVSVLDRDSGYHDHDGSCVGVYVIEGVARNEGLVIGQARRVREYKPGDRFAFPGTGIHRMEHEAGAITIHVHSPPIRSIGEYELQDGELRRRPEGPDESSAASPHLLAALSAVDRPAT